MHFTSTLPLLVISTSFWFAIASAVVQRSDDVPSLQTVVEQQSAIIQTLQSQLAAQQSLITSLQHTVSDVNNKVTSLQTQIQQDHQKQVVFHVRFAGPYDVPLDVGPHATLKFNLAISNFGLAYNTETGIFTAPYAGSYVFLLDATHMPDATASSQLVIKMTGGQILAGTYGNPASVQSNSYIRDTVDTAVHLNVGDQVWVEHSYGATVFRQSGFTTYTGFLVQTD